MNEATFGLVGNTIATGAGLYLDFANPLPEQIITSDIARGLAKTCRFGGQIPGNGWYSVAEHCLLGARWILESTGNPDNAFGFLMHDAAEAYTGDIPKPLKVMLPDFAIVEQRLEAVIFAKYQLRHDIAFIKQCDMAMLKAEKLQLFPHNNDSWCGFDLVTAAPIHVHQLSPVIAAEAWFMLFSDLRDAIA